MPPLRLLPDLESALTRLPDVRAASVVTDAQGAPLEVHVIALPGKPAKQVVRDVQSLALAELGISLDHRTVSVVQLSDDVPPSPALRGVEHPPASTLGETRRVEHAAITTAGDRRVAVVVLAVGLPSGGERVTVGSALVRHDEPDAVARAVLDALDHLHG